MKVFQNGTDCVFQDAQEGNTMNKVEAVTGSTNATPEATIRADNRRDLRTAARAVVLIYWQDERKLPCETTAVIRDVSAGGFGVRTDRSFPEGKSITVRTPERSLECTVRHVQQQPHSFFVGLQIRPSSDGSGHEQSLGSLSAALAASTPE
jgi:hypothetical protein